MQVKVASDISYRMRRGLRTIMLVGGVMAYLGDDG